MKADSMIAAESTMPRRLHRASLAITCLAGFIIVGEFCAAEENGLPRCQLIPLPDHQVAFSIDGIEKMRWHYDSKYPRPFFYPLVGPSGSSLVRMGHPGAPDHDHHRGVWFAHHDVQGNSFWADSGDTQIRQKQWYAYQDGEEEAIMATALGWFTSGGTELLHQELCAAISPQGEGEYSLELQITLTPGDGRDVTQLGKTNFGFLAVRVAKSLSAQFGAGTLRGSEGQTDEPEIFGGQARWVDYSGKVPVGVGRTRTVATEGITYFDHPSNPRYPTRWHVRRDGWMGASFCMDEAFDVTQSKPLRLRYLLHVHSGDYDHAKAEALHEKFEDSPGFSVAPSKRPHHRFEVTRELSQRK